MKSFEELEVWKEGRRYRKEISKLVKDFPKEEKYKLADQLIRSSRSITANIAEGFGRYHFQENIQFCRQARGSLTETLDHLICAYDEEHIPENQLKEFRTMFEHILRLLNGFVSYLQNAKNKDFLSSNSNNWITQWQVTK